MRVITQKLRGNMLLLRAWLVDRGMPYRPDAERHRARDQRLRSMVSHAARQVPHYRDLLANLRVDPEAIRTPEDLALLPILEKNQLRSDPARFTAVDVEGVPFVTSGTTGAPATIIHDHDSLLANIAYAERERAAVSRLIGRRYRYTNLNIVYGTSTILRVQGHNLKRTWVPLRPRREYAFVTDPLPAIVEQINTARPHLRTGYGSYLEMLFRWIAAREARIHRPAAILYGAEPMSDEGRLFIETHFGIPVLSVYNAMESFRIGYMCERRQGFHIHDDLCIVRVVDGDGNPAPEGKPGQIVITNLVNRGTVLLNYRLGDLGTLSARRCDCGRTQPLLTQLEGRKEDILLLPDGSFVHPRAVWSVIKAHPGVLNYQLVQIEPARFELKLAASDPGSIRESLLRGLKGLLGEEAEVEMRECDTLVPPEGKKFRPVIALGRQP